ncbi:MAG TPA: RHS repeat-associated core domain-containing protein, partial [Fimbriimonadaceae bacterium]|nr:RHS repeat-associated core domain-containing protein [Fimbriimonadaceae bacterium]
LISSNRESTKRYFHFDGLGSTVALTDASENITDTYVYSAFGNLLSSTGSSVNPYMYVGQWGYYDDGAMGCQFDMLLLGVRYYVPAYGRFFTWDPMPAVNLYDYTRNSPTMMIDPSGTWPGYGNYCGPRTSHLEPVDKVDQCCKVHDACLKGLKEWSNPLIKRRCQCQLCMCLLAAPCGKFDLKCRLAQTLMLAWACLGCADPVHMPI